MAKAKKGKLTIEDALIPVEEQPYEIPENWCWTTLDMVAGYKKGPFGSSITKAMFVPKGNNTYKVYEQGNAIRKTVQYGEYYITKEKFEELKGFEVHPGDLIVSCAGTIGETYQLPETIEEGVINQALMRVKVSEKVDLKYYLYYFDEMLRQDITGNSKGSAIKNIPPFAVLKKFPYPLPPLEEQKRIVEQIENLFSKLDEAKDNACEVVDKTRLRKSAILQAAFDGTLTKKWQYDNGIEADTWKTKKIRDIVKPVKDKYDPTKDEILDIPYVGLEHIEKSGGIIGSGSPEEVKSTKTLFNKGDILYGKLRPYLDKHDVVDFDGMCSTDILVYRAENEATARYINYLFGTIDFMDYAVENSSGINLPRTSEKIVSAYEVRVPSVEEQGVICDILDSMMHRENAIIEAAEDFMEKVDLMKKSILAKAFRGELGTNIPEEVSSLELLKQIIES